MVEDMRQKDPDADGEARSAIGRLRLVLEAGRDGQLSEAQTKLISRFSDLISKFGDVSKESIVVSILDHVGNYWRNGIIILLQTGSYRPSTLVRIFESLNAKRPISRRMLNLNLKLLERDGLVERNIISSEINHVEYSLTPLGNELSQHILAIIDWSVKMSDCVAEARSAFDLKGRCI